MSHTSVYVDKGDLLDTSMWELSVKVDVYTQLSRDRQRLSMFQCRLSTLGFYLIFQILYLRSFENKSVKYKRLEAQKKDFVQGT